MGMGSSLTAKNSRKAVSVRRKKKGNIGGESSLERSAAQNTAASLPPNKAKLKFPLIKADDDLEFLLNDLLGPDQAKLIMYGSDHASQAGDESVANQDVVTEKLDATLDVNSVSRAGKSLKMGRSSMTVDDNDSVGMGLTEKGGGRNRGKGGRADSMKVA